MNTPASPACPPVSGVLLLGCRSSSFTQADWPSSDRWLRVQAACPEAIDAVVLPYTTRHAGPDAVGVGASMRVVAAWTKTQVRARKANVPARWLWSLKRDQWVRNEMRYADVVVSMDVETDRALAMIPELLAETTVVTSAEALDVGRGLGILLDTLERLKEIVAQRQEPARVRRRALKKSELVGLSRGLDPQAAAAVPGVLLPVVEVSSVIRLLNVGVGRVPAATILLDVLGGFRWESSPLVGESGLAAQLGSARLWLAATEAVLPPDEESFKATEAALVGADLALESNDEALARSRLADSLCLMFHRERHGESGHSALVSDPGRFLRSLYGNKTFIAVTQGGKPRRMRLRPGTGDRVRVLVLTSASGQFHIPVVEALSHVAEVTVAGPELAEAFLSKRSMDVQVIEALTLLRHPELKDPSPDGWGADRANSRVVRALGPRLREADVIFADWADRITVWASHMAPRGARLVLRIHSLDALQPWFHLVNWRNVDHVLVPADMIRQMVEQMLEAAAADVPVSIVDNLIPMGALNQPKLPAARTTLGLVGWGRRVKDPLFALDLLAREPSWRLLLIGRGLHPPTSRSAAAYNAEVEARLADPAIAERVEYVGWTDDVPSELRRIGVILSTSRRESWHLGLVEGAASGAVPVVRDWPIWRPAGGARNLFPAEWVVEDLDQAEARVRAVTDPVAWDDVRLRAQSQAQSLFDPELAARQYCDLIIGSHSADEASTR